MLFDGGLAGSRTKLFDVSGDANGFHVSEFQSALVAPVEELLYRPCVCRAGVAIAKTGSKENNRLFYRLREVRRLSVFH